MHQYKFVGDPIAVGGADAADPPRHGQLLDNSVMVTSPAECAGGCCSIDDIDRPFGGSPATRV